MSLKHLVCGGTLVTDLSPLKGKRIGWLTVSGIPVRDLSPIQGMPLRWLVCQNMAVSDLAPLKSATQIKKLGIAGLKIIGSDSPLDLSWLKELPVEELSVSEDAAIKNAPVLKELKTLKTINDMPAADFWKTHHGSSARTFDLKLRDKERPFVILDRNGKVRTEIAHPVPALMAPQDGETIEIHGHGPFRITHNVDFGDKHVTIRAASGYSPQIERSDENLGQLRIKGGVLRIERCDWRGAGAPFSIEGGRLELIASRITGLPAALCTCCQENCWCRIALWSRPLRLLRMSTGQVASSNSSTT